MTVLDTPRLTLRPWTEEDAPAMHLIFSDLEAMRFWNTPPSHSPEDMLAGIRRSLSTAPEFHAAWAVILKETGHAMGFVAYHHREVQNERLEIGYIFARSFWDRGLATEAVSALLDHCFRNLRANRVEALIDPDNHASVRLAEGIGFQLEGGPMRERLKMPDGRFADILMYGLLAADWKRRAVSAYCDVGS